MKQRHEAACGFGSDLRAPVAENRTGNKSKSMAKVSMERLSKRRNDWRRIKLLDLEAENIPRNDKLMPILPRFTKFEG